jgi:hypothetical protein
LIVVPRPVSYGNTALSQEEKMTRQMKRRTELILPASSAKGMPGGNAPSKSWRLGHSYSLAAQTHVLVVVAPPAPASKGLGEASGVERPVINMCASS